MFNFVQTFPTPNEKTPGKNSNRFIIVHHTGTPEWSEKGVINGLAYRGDFASCHFLIGGDGEAYKFGSPDDILWHAGESQWGKLKSLNAHSLGIEVIGPRKDGGFTDAQRKTLRELVQHLMAVFGIPKENVLRHADLTWEGSRQMKHWDGVSKSRKTDPSPTLWKIDRTTWKQYQDSLIPKQC